MKVKSASVSPARRPQPQGRSAARAATLSRAPAVRKRTRRVVLVATGVVVVAAIGVVTYLSFVGQSAADRQVASAAPLASSSSTDPLEKAVAAVGFHSTMAGAQVGIVENLPDGSQLLPPSTSLLPIGATAPDFTLSTPTGQRVQLSSYRGKTVLLEFFATWCPHCQAEAQHLVRLQASLSSDKVVFLGVNADSEDAASILAFDRFFGIPYPTVLDQGDRPGSFNSAGGEGPVTQRYGIYYFPTFYIVNPAGAIAWRGDREQPDAVLLKELADASKS